MLYKMETKVYSYAFFGVLACFPYILYTSSFWMYILCVVAVYFIYRQIRKRNITYLDPKGHGVVVSGCDTGFGHDLANQLYRSGFTVFAGCLKPDGPGADKLRSCGTDRMHVVALDVTRAEDTQKALEYVKANLPENGLHGIVSNAGILVTGDSELLPIPLFKKAMEVNFFGAVRYIQTFLPLVRQSKGRVVINNSVRGMFTLPGTPAYNASKHALDTYADSLRLEMQKFSVKVALVEPGKFGTATAIVCPEQVQRLESELEEIWSSASDEVKETYGRHYFEVPLIPLRKGLTGANNSTRPVTDAIEDALTSSDPCIRNVVGGGDSFYDSDAMLARLHGILPTRVSDALITRMTGCDRFPSEDGDTKLF